MELCKEERISSSWRLVLLIASLYLITAYITTELLAILPNYAAAFCPAAGIALVAVLIAKRNGLVAVFLGALSFYLIFNRPDILSHGLVNYLLISITMAFAISIQAQLGATLIRRFVGYPAPLINDHDIIKFLILAGPIAGLIAATICTIVLYISAKLSADEFFLTWFTWWIGDAIGVIIVAPLLLLYFNKVTYQTGNWFYPVAMPLLAGLFTFYIFFQHINNLELKQQQLKFGAMMVDVNRSLENEIDLHLETLYSLKYLFVSSKNITREDFKKVASDLLLRHSDVQAYEWIPRVKQNERELYTEKIRSDFDKQFSIREKIDGRMKIAGIADEYYPITYIEPMDGNEEAFGFDISTSLLPRQALFKARSSGKAVVTEPLKLVQEKGNKIGSVIYMPIYNNIRVNVTGAGVQNEFIGVLAAVFNINDLIEHFLSRYGEKDFLIKVTDSSNKESPKILFDDISNKNNRFINAQLFWNSKIAFFDRQWQLDFVPSKAYIINYYSYNYFSILFILLGTIIIFVTWILSSYGKHIQTDNIVEQRTAEIRQEIEYRNKAEQELLNSNELLSSIHSTLSQFVQKKDDENVFKNMLETILHLTGSEYGFIGEVNKNEDGKERIKVHEISYLSPESSPNDFFDQHKDGNLYFENLDNLFGLVITTGEVIISNEPDKDSRAKGRPEDHPSLNNYLGLPLYYNDEVVGLISIANKLGGYSEDTINYLKPLTLTCGSIINAARNENLRRLSEQQLRKVSQAVENNPTMVVISDSLGRIEYANPKFCQVTGYEIDEVVNKDLFFLLTDENVNFNRDKTLKTVLSGEDWQGDFQNITKEGFVFWVQQYISPVRSDGKGVTHIVTVMDDITENKKLTSQLSYQASHDALTGLVNRREFERRLEELLLNINIKGEVHALCVFDLDRFKVINDTSGHIAGDELLKMISELLSSEIRSSDTLARLGGDEFALIIMNCNIGDAERVANQIREKIENLKFQWEGKKFSIGVSIGLVSIDGKITEMNELFKAADTACYVAKDEGRNRVRLYKENDSSLMRLRGEMQWVNILNDALEKDSFQLFGQLISPLNNGTVFYELLLRMVKDDGEMVAPGIFLPVAERYQLSEKVDRWVIKNAFKIISNNNFNIQGFRFSINLSGASISEKPFLDYIVRELQDNNLSGDLICFEITETAAISNLIDASLFIRTLKGLGCHFALDDFGSGISSFGYLKSLPVDYLKIDGMFVKDIEYDPIDMAMVKSINEIGQVMGKKTIAEFVESEKVLDLLSDIGVDYAQGYYIGKPMPFETILNEIESDKKLISASKT